MRVRFFAYLRDLTGCAEAEIPYRETAGALARTVCDTYGEKLRQKFFPTETPPENSGANSGKVSRGKGESPEEEKFGPEIIFLINGRHVSHLGGLAAPLKPDDRVDIFPMVAGG